MPQTLHDKGGRRDCPCLAVLCGHKLVCFHVLVLMKLHLLVDRQNTVIKVHTIPCQPQQLPLPQAGEQGHKKSILKAVSLNGFHEVCDLFFIKRFYFLFLDFWQLAEISIRRV